ncbi:MAG: fatty acid--CoA ligase family protein [Myxococcota bacterium]
MDLASRIDDVLAIDPAANAIEFEGRWTTWGELAAASAALGRALDAAGAPADAPVGVLLRNRPEAVAALLGVLRSRRCVVTLSPHQGDAALRRDLERLALPVVVACAEDADGGALAAACDATDTLLLRCAFGGDDDACVAPRGARTRVLDARTAPEHRLPGVAVQMLTSGTTGPPKRVDLGRAALEHSLAGAKHYEKDKAAAPRLRAGVAIIASPLVHVSGIFRVLQCATDGRAFALLDRFRVEPWRDLVVKHRPKTASLVPTAVRMVLEAKLDPADLASLKAVVSGTAPLAPEDAEAFEAQYGVPVLTSYGATEFAGGVAGWSLPDHVEFRREKRGSVGRAHPGCALRIVDPADGRALAPGEEGVLEVHSAQLGPKSDWVRTTDRARMDADGFLWITGRADAAILRGGFKVHPEEVVAALEEHPSVREACVVGLDDARLGQVPVAAVELHADAPRVDGEALRDFARERLAAYMVPSRVLVVDALPRTPSMKPSQPGVRALFANGDAGARGGAAT